MARRKVVAAAVAEGGGNPTRWHVHEGESCHGSRLFRIAMVKQRTPSSGPSFQKTRLTSGVRVVTETIPSVRSISVGLWIGTGSRDEHAETSGISHFIEHMVFKGTRRRRMHHIAQRMESVGGYLNAFTGKEYTCFFARALDEHLDRAIDTVCDLVLEPSFPEKELAKEKDVVLEEIKMYEDVPEDAIFDRFEAAIYRGHPLARPVLGDADSVRQFTREMLLDYVATHYTPDRMIVAVAGHAEHEDVLRLVERGFAGRLSRQAPPQRDPVEDYQPEHLVERRPIQQAHLVLGTRGYHALHEQRAALSVLNTILGGGMSSRLNQNIREKYGYAYAIYSFLNMHSDAGDVGVYLGTDASNVDRSKALILRELEKLAHRPVSQRMLQQAKNQVKGTLMLGLESMSNRMMRVGRQELYFGRYFSLDEVMRELDEVTSGDVQAVASDLFEPHRLSSVVLLPQE